jgi:hypothetical protein
VAACYNGQIGEFGVTRQAAPRRPREEVQMSKALTIGAMVIAILLLILFAVDLIDWLLGALMGTSMGFPFKGASPLMDIAFVIGSIILAYLAWSSYKELQ